MIRTVALASSLVANAALLVAWLDATPPASERAPVVLPSPAKPTAGDFSRWLALGLAEDEARRLLFVTLETAALAAIDNPWRRYWEVRDPALAYATELRRAYASLREELERRFGRAASAAPEFSRAFRPLDAQYEFLSSADQLALQAMRLRDRDAATQPSCELAVPPTGARPTLPSVTLGAFPSDVAFEIALRESPRAEQLRRSGVDFSEAEFRDTFRLLERLESSDKLDVHLAVRRQLHGRLGTAKWTAIAAARDPLFPVVERVAKSFGLAETTALAAYGVLSDIQDERLELSVQGRREPALAADVAAREIERLSAVVGETAAERILSAREHFYRQLMGGRAGPPVAN